MARLFLPSLLYLYVAWLTLSAAFAASLIQPYLSLYADWIYTRLGPGLPTPLALIEWLYAATFEYLTRMVNGGGRGGGAGNGAAGALAGSMP